MYQARQNFIYMLLSRGNVGKIMGMRLLWTVGSILVVYFTSCWGSGVYSNCSR
jgi:hypothetical protein